jgi:hypothetical protein
MSIGMSPYKDLYSYDPLTFEEIVFGESKAHMAKEWIQVNKEIIRELKDNLHRAQNQQKLYADRKRVEHTFKVGDLVYLRLQPYRQASIKKSGDEKLQPRFYGPYEVQRRIGEVAYELKLPPGSKIHNVLRVSCLKKTLGQHVLFDETLPPMYEEGKIHLVPERTLETRVKQLRSKAIKEYLVKWKDFPIKDATWESERTVQENGYGLLEDK